MDAFARSEPILTSPDGTNWTTVEVPIECALSGVSFLNGAFAAVGLQEAPQGAALLLSGDGTTWTNHSLPTPGGYCWL